MPAAPVTITRVGTRLPPISWANAFMTILLGLVIFLVAVPLVLTIVASFQLASPGLPAVYGIDGWVRAFGDPSIWRAFGNTVSLVLVRVPLTLLVGVVIAWLLVRTDLPLKGPIEFMFWVTFFLPSLPVAMGWMLLLDPSRGVANHLAQTLPFVDGPLFNVYSFWGIVWAHMGFGVATKVLLLSPALRNLDAALEESSRIAGVGTLGTLRNIVIPIMAPALLVVTTLSVIHGLEAFEIELILGIPFGFFVFSTKIYDFVRDYPANYASATALCTVFLIILLALVIFQRWYLSRRVYKTVTGRGFSSRPTALGRWRYVALAFIGLFILVFTLLPVFILIMGSFMTAFGYYTIPEPWTLENWRRVLADPILLSSLRNTVVVAVGAAAGGVLLYSLIAYTVIRTRFGGRGMIDVLSWLPIAVPGILLGLALLWTVFLTRFMLPIYGTVYILMIAMIINTMPTGVQIFKSVVVQLGDELEEASRVAGASWVQTYRRILAPLLMPTFVTVGIWIFIGTVRNISAVVLLGSSESRTLALLMLDYAVEGAQYEAATVVALVQISIMVVVALLARRLRGSGGLATHQR